MDEKDGRGKPGLETPSISQAELDELIGPMDTDQLPSDQHCPVRPLMAKPIKYVLEDLVPGDGIDQSELDALFSEEGDKKLYADTPAQAKGANEGPGLSQAELNALLGGSEQDSKASEPAKNAKSASPERILSQEEIDAMLAALGN